MTHISCLELQQDKRRLKPSGTPCGQAPRFCFLPSCPGCSWLGFAHASFWGWGVGAGAAVAFIGLLNLVLRLRRLRSSFVVLECFWGISCCFRILERNESNER